MHLGTKVLACFWEDMAYVRSKRGVFCGVLELVCLLSKSSRLPSRFTLCLRSFAERPGQVKAHRHVVPLSANQLSEAQIPLKHLEIYRKRLKIHRFRVKYSKIEALCPAATCHPPSPLPAPCCACGATTSPPGSCATCVVPHRAPAPHVSPS